MRGGRQSGRRAGDKRVLRVGTGCRTEPLRQCATHAGRTSVRCRTLWRRWQGGALACAVGRVQSAGPRARQLTNSLWLALAPTGGAARDTPVLSSVDLRQPETMRGASGYTVMGIWIPDIGGVWRGAQQWSGPRRRRTLAGKSGRLVEVTQEHPNEAPLSALGVRLARDRLVDPGALRGIASVEEPSARCDSAPPCQGHACRPSRHRQGPLQDGPGGHTCLCGVPQGRGHGVDEDDPLDLGVQGLRRCPGARPRSRSARSTRSTTSASARRATRTSAWPAMPAMAGRPARRRSRPIPENVDCLACHADPASYGKGLFGNPAPSVDLLAAARSVRATTRENCGKCHFDGGGGNGVKHGDLDESLYFPGRNAGCAHGRQAQPAVQRLPCHAQAPDPGPHRGRQLHDRTCRTGVLRAVPQAARSTRTNASPST